MRIRIAFVGLGFCLMSIHAGVAQDVPPQDVLNAILRQVTPTRPVSTAVTFEPSGNAANGLCRLQPAQMNLTRDGAAVRSFSVLVDNAAGANAPREFFATVTRIAIDSDGAGRTYHPEDPLGQGVCQKTTSADGKDTLSGICALDQFSSSGTYLFDGSRKLPSASFAANWAAIWPKIRDRMIKSVVLADAYGPQAPREFYLFYMPERRLTALFRDNIIPKDRAGYPCRFTAASELRKGYFISSTTLETNAAVRDDGCAPDRYLDSEVVPFIVLPKGGFGKVRIGDIAVVRFKGNTVYAIVGDAGPANKFGEGSIALNAKLLGKFGAPFANMKETWTLDIEGSAVSMLVLGDTRGKLKGDYSPGNIETVARRELATWNGGGDPFARFDACQAAATVNRGSK